jgi:hypothetical protein
MREKIKESISASKAASRLIVFGSRGLSRKAQETTFREMLELSECLGRQNKTKGA